MSKEVRTNEPKGEGASGNGCQIGAAMKACAEAAKQEQKAQERLTSALRRNMVRIKSEEL